MEDALSPTDVSSSLSEFVRKERILKELYQENNVCQKTFELKPLQYNDAEIDGILQQMGRLLSPAGQESDEVYKHVIEETENKSIEQILNEAKELISDTTPIPEKASICFSTDEISSESSENDTTFVNIEDTIGDTDDAVRIKNKLSSQLKEKQPPVAKPLKNGSMPMKNQYSDSKTETLYFPKMVGVSKSQHAEEIQSLRKEVVRVTRLYDSCKVESADLKKEISRLEV